jgi:hypothetical protein
LDAWPAPFPEVIGCKTRRGGGRVNLRTYLVKVADDNS